MCERIEMISIVLDIYSAQNSGAGIPGQPGVESGPTVNPPNRVLDGALKKLSGGCSETNEGGSAPAPPFSEQVAGRLELGTTDARPRRAVRANSIA
jgi:hypothetical protein